MKIRELIQKLSEYNSDLIVVIKSEQDSNVITDIEVDRVNFKNEAGFEVRDLALIIK